MPSYFQKAREPVNSFTHFIGMVFSVFATVLLVVLSLFSPTRSLIKTVSVLVFGLSLVALYSASTHYHYVCGATDHRLLWLRKLDHSMIYVLIAGSYTPIVLAFFPAQTATPFILVIWCIAAAGILIKLCWMGAPRWLSTLLYILMGWAVLVDLPALAAMPLPAILLLVAGGVAYTVGGVIYALKKPNLSSSLGFHELFHIFVLLGSFLHFLVVLLYVV